MTQRKCQDIYYNLLTSLNYKEMTAPIYLRELWYTESCDKFSDLSDVRRNIEEDVTAPTVARILAFQETKRDEARAAQTRFADREYHHQRLWRSLTFSNKLYYRFVDIPHEMLANIGLISPRYDGVRVALQIHKNRNDMRRSAEEAFKMKFAKAARNKP